MQSLFAYNHCPIQEVQMEILHPFNKNLLHDLKEDTTGAPHVHLKAVVAVSEEALWGSVPACGDVLCVRGLGVDTAT